eukprot:1362213-Amorphochlora_amoeboformis.AAC.1
MAGGEGGSRSLRFRCASVEITLNSSSSKGIRHSRGMKLKSSGQILAKNLGFGPLLGLDLELEVWNSTAGAP